MKLPDFRIGLEFHGPEGRWRCTDVGSRVIVAIQIDTIIISEIDVSMGKRVDRTINGAQAECEGWFSGPTIHMRGGGLRRGSYGRLLRILGADATGREL